MEQGTINKDITLKYDTDSNNLVVSTYVATKKSVDDLSNKVNKNESKINTVDNRVTDVSNKADENKSKIITVDDRVTDLSNRVNADEARISIVDKVVTDLCNEVKTDKENIEALFSRIKWVEKVFIITFCLIMLNCFYVIFTLMQKG